MIILLAVAMRKEYEGEFGINDMLNLKKAPPEMQLDENYNAPVYQGELNEHSIILVPAGVSRKYSKDRIGPGIIQAFSVALEKFKPDLVINVGSAGGSYEKGYKVGDLVLCDGAAFHNRLLEPDLNHTDYSVGNYKLSDVSRIAKKLSFKIDKISTGSSLLASIEEDIQYKKNGAGLKDMEAAHLAECCDQLETNFLALKIVSDLIDIGKCPQKQFEKHISKVKLTLADALKKLLHLITSGLPTDGVTDGAGIKRTSSIEWSFPLFCKKEQTMHPSPSSQKHTFAASKSNSPNPRKPRRLAKSGSNVNTTTAEPERLKRKLTPTAGTPIDAPQDRQHSWTNENVNPGKMDKKDIKQRSWTLNEGKKSENKPSSNDDAASLTTRSNTCG